MNTTYPEYTPRHAVDFFENFSRELCDPNVVNRIRILDALVVHTHFAQVWDAYPEPYKSVIDAARLMTPVRVVTDDAEINSNVRVAGHLAGRFYFRWQKIPIALLDTMIIHEIAHYYIDAVERLEITYYMASNEDAEARLRRVESRAIEVERVVNNLIGVGIKLCRSIDAAQKEIFLVTSAAGDIEKSLDGMKAATNRSVKIKILWFTDDIGLSGLGDAATDWIRAMGSSLVLHTQKNSQSGLLRLVCLIADQQHAFFKASTSLDENSGNHGLYIIGERAGELQAAFESQMVASNKHAF